MDNRERPAVLALEDGALFYGWTSTPEGSVCAEIVFNTSMTGYQEVCTDPSYAGQMVLFTTSHIGNVGVNTADNESDRPWVRGVIARALSTTHSNWRSEQSFISWLNEHQLLWMEGVDTRKLTRHLRKTGTQNACLMTGHIDVAVAIDRAKRHRSATAHLPSQVIQPEDALSLTDSLLARSSAIPRLIVYDFGIKSSIVNMLAQLGCEVACVPYTTPAAEVLACRPDGIVLSNGPGDPAGLSLSVEEIQELLFSGIPVLGICLGCQLIAIAAGGRTARMAFGHHGINHPVYAIDSQKVHITSQNHNFAIEAATLPTKVEVTHISLFDGSIQGIRLKNLPVSGFQGHPEGSPGPQDAQELFHEFLKKVRAKNAVGSLA